MRRYRESELFDWMPVPSVEAVAKFRKLARDERNLEFETDGEAREAATRLLQVGYVMAVYAAIDQRKAELKAQGIELPQASQGSETDEAASSSASRSRSKRKRRSSRRRAAR